MEKELIQKIKNWYLVVMLLLFTAGIVLSLTCTPINLSAATWQVLGMLLLVGGFFIDKNNNEYIEELESDVYSLRQRLEQKHQQLKEYQRALGYEREYRLTMEKLILEEKERQKGENAAGETKSKKTRSKKTTSVSLDRSKDC